MGYCHFPSRSVWDARASVFARVCPVCFDREPKILPARILAGRNSYGSTRAFHWRHDPLGPVVQMGSIAVGFTHLRQPDTFLYHPQFWGGLALWHFCPVSTHCRWLLISLQALCIPIEFNGTAGLLNTHALTTDLCGRTRRVKHPLLANLRTPS